MQFYDILHVCISSVYSQFERNVLIAWNIYSVILKSKEYDSNVYVEWKNRLDTHWLGGDMKLILTKDHRCAFHSSDKDREAYDRWNAASSHVKQLMLALVGNARG